MAMLSEVANGVEIAVKAVPGASRTRLAGQLGDAIKIHVSAPPERGKANEAVEKLLAETLGIPARAVKVVTGQTSARKTVLAAGVSIARVKTALGVK